MMAALRISAVAAPLSAITLGGVLGAETAARCAFDMGGEREAIVVTIFEKSIGNAAETHKTITTWRQEPGGDEFNPVSGLYGCSHCGVKGAAVHLTDGSMAMITVATPYSANQEFSELTSEDNMSARAIYTRQGIKLAGDKWHPFSETAFGWCSQTAADSE